MLLDAISLVPKSKRELSKYNKNPKTANYVFIIFYIDKTVVDGAVLQTTLRINFSQYLSNPVPKNL